MAVSATTKDIKPSTAKISKPLVTGLTKVPANAAPKAPANAAPKVPANAVPQRPVTSASTRKVPVTGASTRKVPVTGTLEKAQVASAVKTKATGVPKTNASGTPTGHGTGQQRQQHSVNLNVPGAGQQRQGHGQPVRAPPTPLGYDVTEVGSIRGQVEVVPQALLENRIKDVFVEFLRVSSDNPQAKNHVVFKIDFLAGPDGHWPGNYQGARVHMEVDHDVMSESSRGGGRYQPGTLYVKPVGYPDKSNGSVRTFLLHPGRSAQGVKLKDILDVIVEQRKLGLFSFQELNDRYYGCRDFMTQAIRVLELAGYISSAVASVKPAIPQLPRFTNIFEALRCRFRLDDAGTAGMDGGYSACVVDKGLFLEHQRIGENALPYI